MKDGRVGGRGGGGVKTPVFFHIISINNLRSTIVHYPLSLLMSLFVSQTDLRLGPGGIKSLSNEDGNVNEKATKQ